MSNLDPMAVARTLYRAMDTCLSDPHTNLELATRMWREMLETLIEDNDSSTGVSGEESAVKTQRS